MTRPRAGALTMVSIGLSFFLGAAVRATAQAPLPPSSLEVTKLPGWHARVCWPAVAGANIYSIRYRVAPTVVSEILQVPSTAAGTICSTVSFSQNEYSVYSCYNHEVTIASGTISGDSAVFGAPSVPHPLPFNTVFDDPTAPEPWCGFTDSFNVHSIDRRATLAPSGLMVTDTSTNNATLKLGITCPGSAPAGYSIDHYEIYENSQKANGTRSTRTTTSASCPNNKALTGTWGERVTITVAAIFSTGSGQNKTYQSSLCSNSVTVTYGGIVLPAPLLTVPQAANAAAITITGSVPTTSAINVLLFVNPTTFNQSAPTQTITSFTTVGSSKTFTATIPLNTSLNTVYAVTRTGSGNSTRYSSPSAASFVKNYPPPLAVPTWGSLPAYQVGGHLHLTGTTAVGARVNVTPVAPDGATLPTVSTDGCSNGVFGAPFPLSGLAPGAYTFTARTPDGGSTGQTAATVYVNELYPAPTLALDVGPGPVYVSAGTISLRGSVSPAGAGPGFVVTGTLGAQTVTATPAATGIFTLPALTLAQGTNAITVNATYTATGQSTPPAPTSVVRDSVAPTATVNFATQIPSPTNQATWTLSGTITGYQGAAENSEVVLTGTPTGRFPIATNGTWTGSYTFAEGRNTFTFRVADPSNNLGPTSPQYTVDVLTQGLKPLFDNLDGISDGPSEGPWPATLDNQYRQQLFFRSENGTTLNGSRLDLFLDETASPATGSTPSCPRDNLSCLVTRKITPDLTVTFTGGNSVVLLPALTTGLHNIRIVLTDPFGFPVERGAVVVVGPQSGWSIGGKNLIAQPLANLVVPGTVTTRTPKLAGRSVDALIPIDCADLVGGNAPKLTYYKSQGGGTWEILPILTSVETNGFYEVVPNYAAIGGQLPVTNAGSGQVLRIRVEAQNPFDPPSGSRIFYGRDICNAAGTGRLVSGLYQGTLVYGGTEGVFVYDLPYRAPAGGDNPAPQVDTSATTPTSFVTGDEPLFSARIKFRVTDLNADLDYRSVTVTPPGCADSSCVITPRLDGEQQLTTTTPGGWYSAMVNLVLGQNTFVITARDDANHTSTANLTLTRSLFHVIAKISSPVNEGQTYYFCSPKAVTFDASNSINQTSPYADLRYQWTTPGFQVVSTAASFTQTITGADSRRVIVSNSSINPAPNPGLFDPCGGWTPGECSVASVNLQPFGVPPGNLPAQINSPTNGASVRMDQPVTLEGTVGIAENSNPSYVYRWRLRRNSDSVYFAIPQSTGTGSDPSFAYANRTLTLRLDSISGVTAETYTLLFDAAYQTTPGGCIAQQTTSSIGITVTTKVYTATGVAPGVTIPGGAATRLYGSGFDAAAQIAISGPVYALPDPGAPLGPPLCTMPACPQIVVPATVGGDATTLDFTTPTTLTPGIHLVFASDPSSGAASSALWLEVQPSQASAPAKTQQFTNIIRPLTNGQALNGEFLAGRDPSGQFSDVDYYYFFATAGSIVNLSLSRSDSSLPWEAPDALDPQLTLIDPDGIISQGFEAFDDQEGADLNASIANLVLPKTGRYTVYAANSKGFGPYQLTYALTPVSPSSGRQVVPATNNDRTVRVDVLGLKPMALAFDKRGHPLSGAVAQFVATPEAGETGQITFPFGSSLATSTRGFVQVDAKLITAGKVSFEARLQDSSVLLPQGALLAQTAAAVPRYRPAATVIQREAALDPFTGEGAATFGPIERLELAPPETPVTTTKPGNGKTPKTRPDATITTGTALAQSSTGHPGRVGTLSAEVITNCDQKQFRAAGVNADVSGPFTVTLTDLTPKTGQTSGTEVIGIEGIHEHRVNKTIRIKIDIKDSTGAQPGYPVLVHLSLAGITPGMLILDPDSPTPLECQSVAFLWHERDSQGQIIALNEEFEYRLGTTASFVGVKPDPQNPGDVLPVWGTAEFLDVFFGTFDQAGTLTNQYTAKHGVHPESGSPDHFLWNPTLPPPPHRKDYLAAYGATFGTETATFTNGTSYQNLYYLADQWNNKIYGFRTTSATDPASNVNMTFTAQDPGLTTVNPAGYQLTVEWNDNPSGASPKPSSQWPNGDQVSTLSVTGTDAETGPFNITQAYTAVFSQPTFYSLVWVDGYDQPIDLQIDDSVTPPVPITHVSPGAARTRLNGELSRNSILLVTGTRLSWTSVTPVGWIGPPGTDPTLVTDGLDSFDVSLVDDEGNLVTDSEIQVAFCPIFQEPLLGPCPSGNRTSTGGVILSVRPIDRGYMGLMISRAPTAPGVYFFRINPVAGNTHQWRIGGSLDPQNNYTYTYAVTVQGGEYLNENFARFPQGIVKVTEPTLVYLRYANPSGPGPATADLTTLKQDGTELQSGVSLTLSKLASSSVYMGEFTAVPDGDTNPPPPGRPSISIALGGGQIKAIQATAGTLSAQPLGVRPRGAQSSNGGLLAMAPTAFPGELRLKFMTREGSALAPNTTGDPNDPGTQLTEIGDKSDDYVEKVWVEIQAFNPKRRTEFQNTNAPVGLVEYLNPNYTASTNRFYDGTNGSTLLDDSGKIGGTATGSFAAMVGGKVQIELKAVADRRLLVGAGNSPDAALPYFALVQPVPADPGDLRAPRVGTAKNVRQWVDERAYERRRTDSLGSWGSPDSSNSVRDWLEKKAWDTYTDTLDTVGGQLDEGCRVLTTIAESVTQPDAGLVLSGSPWRVTFNPLVLQLRHPLPPTHPTPWWSSYYYGFYERDPADGFPAVALHESRHSWQFTLTSRGAQDLDGDVLFAPGTVPSSSAELLDAGNRDGVIGGNGDGHFRGDGIGLADIGEAVRTMREHEAMRFLAPGRAGIALEIACALSGFSLYSGGNQTGPPNQQLPALITVKVEAMNTEPTGQVSQAPRPGTTVKFVVLSGGGLVNGASEAYAMTDDAGMASVTVTNGAFDSQIQAQVLPPMAPQSTCSSLPVSSLTTTARVQ